MPGGAGGQPVPLQEDRAGHAQLGQVVQGLAAEATAACMGKIFVEKKAIKTVIFLSDLKLKFHNCASVAASNLSPGRNCYWDWEHRVAAAVVVVADDDDDEDDVTTHL